MTHFYRAKAHIVELYDDGVLRPLGKESKLCFDEWQFSGGSNHFTLGAPNSVRR